MIFWKGAKEGLKTVKGLVPVLVGLMTAVRRSQSLRLS